jgi:CheY-like chemotaxis protein
LRILIVEDEALISMDLQFVLEDLGHDVVGIATTYDMALELAVDHQPDLAFVDIQLLDGQTGIDVAAALSATGSTHVVFTSGNISKIPGDYAGAIGSIGKPYSERGMKAALGYLSKGLLDPPPSDHTPPSLTLSPSFRQRWLEGAS